jgi:hypothetical protein
MVIFPYFILDEDEKVHENPEGNKKSHDYKDLVNEFILVSSSQLSTPIKQEGDEEQIKIQSVNIDKKENNCIGLCLYSNS